MSVLLICLATLLAISDPGSRAAGEEPPLPRADAVDDRTASGTAPLAAGDACRTDAIVQRAAELDARSDEIAVREALLRVAEEKLARRIDQLEELSHQVQAGLEQLDDQEEKRLQRLVKVYEAMKPKRAARVFERLQMDVLRAVVVRMREAKVAPIVQEMDPVRARQLTTELARARMPVAGLAEEAGG